MTAYLKHYLAKFAGRLLVFLLFLCLYAARRADIGRFMQAGSLSELQADAAAVPGTFLCLVLLWILFVWTMLTHLFPGLLPERLHTYALLKSMPEYAAAAPSVPAHPAAPSMPGHPADSSVLEHAATPSVPAHPASDPSFPEQKLPPILIEQNRGARYVMVAWCLLNCPVFLLHRRGVIGGAELLLLTVFYYVCDYICILLWCPFQTFLMKCKCCVNCRIFDWGHIMMFTPMAFAGGILPKILFLVSAAVFVRWEISFAKYPAQFNEWSNPRLRCATCQERICAVKKGVKRRLTERSD